MTGGRPRKGVDPADVTAAVARIVADKTAPDGVTIQLVGVSGDNPVVCLDEKDRFLRVPVDRIADWIDGNRRYPGRVDVPAAVNGWIARRPVPDDDATDRGIASLGWRNDRIAWRVFLDRNGLLVPWDPSPRMSSWSIKAVREAATVRASQVRARMWSDGEVAIWRCDQNPSLTCSALVNPQRMLAQMKEQGLPVRNVRFVVSPPGAVAAAPAGPAARLAAELSEQHAVVAPDDLDTLEWL